MFNTSDVTNKVTQSIKNLDFSGLNPKQAVKGLLGLPDDSDTNDKIKASDVVKIGNFIFDFVGNIRVQMQNNITTNLTESNKVMTDNISLQPLTITFDGYIGECFIDRANTGQEIVNQTTKTASIILGLLPQNTATKYLKNLQMGVDYLYGVGKSVLKTLKNHSYQIEGFNKLENMRNVQGTYTVVLPYRTFYNMAIKDLVFEQPANTKDYTHVSMTLQQILTFKVKQTKFIQQEKQLSTGDFTNLPETINETTYRTGDTSQTNKG
jgi:hypothetical protein